MKELFALNNEELETLTERLTRHAQCLLHKLTWRGAYIVKGGSVPGGYEAYDFAIDAIEKMCDGRRSWNRQRYETLLSALKAVIDSDINHLVESADNVLSRRLAPQSARCDTAKAYEAPGTEGNPLQIVIDTEWQERFHKAVMKELDGDEFLVKLFECLKADFTKPEEIATMLDKTVEDVNNAKKRLARKLEKLEKKFPPPNRRAK